jgi:hypothetical protein
VPFFNLTGSVYYVDCTTEMLTQYAWYQMYLATQFGMENFPDVMRKSYRFIKEKWPNDDDQIVVITREEYDCILEVGVQWLMQRFRQYTEATRDTRSGWNILSMLPDPSDESDPGSGFGSISAKW